MRVLFGLAVVAATLYGAPQPTDARAIAANDAHTAYQASIAKSHRDVAQLPRDLEPDGEEIFRFGKRDRLTERAGVPRLGSSRGHGEVEGPGGSTAHGGSSGDESGTAPGSSEDAPIRLGTGDTGTGSGQGSGEDIPVRLGADRGTASTGDTPGTTPEDFNENLPTTNIGASKKGDPGPEKLEGGDADIKKKRTKGAQVDKESHDALANTKDPDKADLDKSYTYHSDPAKKLVAQDPSTAKDLGPVFEDLEMPRQLDRGKYIRSEVLSKAPGTEKPNGQGRYNGKDGIIIGEARFSANDKNPEPPKRPDGTPDLSRTPQKIRQSDLTFLQFERATKAQGGKLTDLKLFIGRNVISKSTLQAMQKSQKDTKQDLDRISIFERPAQRSAPDQLTAQEKAWDTMLGTDFISSLNYMLKDNMVALGKKEIARIKCYPRTYDPSTDLGQEKITIAVSFRPVP